MKKKLTKKLLRSAVIMTTQLVIYQILLIKKNYRLIAIDLSEQIKLKDPQQINFIGKIEGKNNGVTIFFIIERSEETTFEFSQNSVNILQKWKYKNYKFIKYFRK